MTVGGSTETVSEGELAQMRQWYTDPVRNLPRKVTADVSALLGYIAARDVEIERLRRDLHHVLRDVPAVAARVDELKAALRTLREAASRPSSDHGETRLDDAWVRETIDDALRGTP
jgi:hypothetical protein